jgi:hypothetical protein
LISGTGKGGNSIWGEKFEDEFHEDLKVFHKNPPFSSFFSRSYQDG